MFRFPSPLEVAAALASVGSAIVARDPAQIARAIVAGFLLPVAGLDGATVAIGASVAVVPTTGQRQSARVCVTGTLRVQGDDVSLERPVVTFSPAES